MPRPFYPRERTPGTHCVGVWVDPRAGLDDMEKWKFFILPWLVQPVASRYTDCAIPAPRKVVKGEKTKGTVLSWISTRTMCTWTEFNVEKRTESKNLVENVRLVCVLCHKWERRSTIGNIWMTVLFSDLLLKKKMVKKNKRKKRTGRNETESSVQFTYDQPHVALTSCLLFVH
jgi:hypothetical protein